MNAYFLTSSQLTRVPADLLGEEDLHWRREKIFLLERATHLLEVLARAVSLERSLILVSATISSAYVLRK